MVKRGIKIIITKSSITLFLISISLIFLAGFVSAENISTCGELNQSNTVYTLQNNIVGGISGTCFIITADNIILDGNGYQIDSIYGARYGIRAVGINNLTIKNFSRINRFGPFGIYFDSVSNSLITDVSITATQDGITLVSSSNNMITNVAQTGSGYGFQLLSSSDNTIMDNSMSGSNGDSLRLSSSSNNIITNNIINAGSATDVGIRIESNSNNNQLINNRITNNAVSTDVNWEILDTTGNSYINYLIYNNSFGEIRWTNISDGGFLKDLDIEGNIDLGTNLEIGNNTVYLDALAFTLGLINSSANITLYGMDSFNFTNPAILRNGVDCGSDCIKLTSLNVATIKFNVAYIGANYSIGEGPIIPLENATFENVNVANDLTVGKNIFSLNGFFDFLGSSVSRIIKGWFNEIDVITLTASFINSNIIDANTITATGSITVNNSQVCLEDGTNCPIDENSNILSFTINVDDTIAAGNDYGALSGTNTFNTDESKRQNVIPTNCLFKNLYVDVASNNRATNSIVNLRINSVDGSLSIVIPGNTVGVFSDTVNTDNVNAGDLVNYEITRGGGVGFTRIGSISVLCEVQ